MKFILIIILLFSSNAYADRAIRIVGSSTLYPFITAAAERFGKPPEYRTPIVESTGSGGGIKLFCSGDSMNSPDIVNSSRKIKKSEIELCASNGITEIREIIIGYDGIVLASSKKAPEYKVSKKELFLALAKYVPKEGKVVENFYKKWSAINSKLPDYKIKVYGPSFTSGTREAFVELILIESCKDIQEFNQAFPDGSERAAMCGQIREDGAYGEVGENDNLIIQKLLVDQKAVGIIGYNFLQQSKSKIRAVEIDGFYPSYVSIAKRQYAVSRPLYVYLNTHRQKSIPSIDKFIEELTGESAIGKHGYLRRKGLISSYETRY
jgi:phosphate transport system substrate-binding protein